MNLDHEKTLVRLCGLMVDGTLEEIDAQRLTGLLEQSADARAFYRNIMDVHARLLLQYEEAPAFEESTREPRHTETYSFWWQVAAAALVLFAGLNLIQSAGNLTAVQPFETTPIAHGTPHYLSHLKEILNAEPNDQP